MELTLKDFKQQVDGCKKPEDVDSLCMAWLKLVCMDNGKQGDRAHKLLEVVASMLWID